MSAPKGNVYWKDRTESGRKLIWSTPDELWKECKLYFEETSKRVWNKTDFRGSKVTKVEIPTSAPFTMKGLCLFLDCSLNTFLNYEVKEDFFHVTRKVRHIIETQQIEGAVTGAFNSNIIARLVGLADKTENTNRNINMNSPELSAEDMKKFNDTLENDF